MEIRAFAGIYHKYIYVDAMSQKLCGKMTEASLSFSQIHVVKNNY